MRTRLLPLSLLSLIASAHAADTWDLTNDFSFTSNPNSVWTYGEVVSSSFKTYPSTIDTGDFRGWSGTSAIFKNVDSSQQFGIDPGQVSLECDNGSPDARWTAPYTGAFSLDVAIGKLGNPGNSGVDGSELLISGVSQTPTSFLQPPLFIGSDEKIFQETVTLTKGQTIDAVGAQNHGGGNTQIAFTVVGQPTPEPESLAAVGIGVLALLRRRRRA